MALAVRDPAGRLPGARRLDAIEGQALVRGMATAYRGPTVTSATPTVGACPCPSPTTPRARSCSARRPIQRLDRLTKHLGGATVWAKREDCNSGLAFGGNKVRKLEYLLADALAQGCDTLVSIGGVQSNHTRQVAAVAAHAGLKCVLVQESWVDWPDVTYDRVGNILMSRLMGADVRLVTAGFGIGFKESWEQALADVRAGGGKPYAIPAGRVGPPARRPRLRRVGVRGRGAGARARRVLRHDHRVLGHGLDAGGHDRRLRGRSRTRAGGRRRVVGIDGVGDAGRDPRAGRPDRAPDGRDHRPRSATSARTRSSSTTATTRACTGSRTPPRSTRCASPPASRA